MVALQTGTPNLLELRGKFPMRSRKSAYHNEGVLHEYLKYFNVGGEWFRKGRWFCQLEYVLKTMPYPALTFQLLDKAGVERNTPGQYKRFRHTGLKPEDPDVPVDLIKEQQRLFKELTGKNPKFTRINNYVD